VVQQTTVQAQDKPVNRIDLKEGATVEDLVQELQRTGAGARDVISIKGAAGDEGGRRFGGRPGGADGGDAPTTGERR
jgi:flagellar basal body P-ring protein FlgI